MVATQARNATLEDAVALLTEQQAHKVDVVVPFSALVAVDGAVVLSGVEAAISDEGVTDPNGLYLPTDIGNESIAGRLSIPTPYMRRMREPGNLALWDCNVNHWLDAEPSRSVLVRLFAASHGETAGIFRSMSSDRFKVMDHLDNILAILGGLRDSGIEFAVSGVNLSERKLTMKVEAPAIKVAATTLLRGYRSPFTGQDASELPWIHAGFSFTNSETGFGSMSAAPEATVQVCNNGMRRNVDLFRAVHLGSRLAEGIQWKADTQDAAMALVTKQVRDTVATYCSQEYLEAWVADLEGRAAVEVANPEKAIKVIARRVGFSEIEAAGILGHFIKGGQATAGGLMQATTSFAQTITNPDRADEVIAVGEQVLSIAASL